MSHQLPLKRGLLEGILSSLPSMSRKEGRVATVREGPLTRGGVLGAGFTVNTWPKYVTYGLACFLCPVYSLCQRTLTSDRPNETQADLFP